jgi:hypothetical protein
MQHVDFGFRGNTLETMQTGDMEAELRQIVRLTSNHQRAAGRRDQTNASARVLGLEQLRSIAKQQARVGHPLGLGNVDRRL